MVKYHALSLYFEDWYYLLFLLTDSVIPESASYWISLRKLFLKLLFFFSCRNREFQTSVLSPRTWTKKNPK